MPDDVNQAIIRILNFCMEDDCEVINIEYGHETVWGRIIREGLVFISKASLTFLLFIFRWS